MPQTPNTSATGYCTVAQMLTFCDPRPLCDLCSVDETRLTAAALQTNPILLANLLASSGVFESAATTGGRYTPADLAALTGAGQALLQRLVAKHAEGEIYRIRKQPLPDEDYDEIVRPGGWLSMLENGERIFPFQETQDAGRMKEQEVVESDIQARRLATTQARRYWGARAQDWQ
jgi:hypothetical protein